MDIRLDKKNGSKCAFKMLAKQQSFSSKLIIRKISLKKRREILLLEELSLLKCFGEMEGFTLSMNPPADFKLEAVSLFDDNGIDSWLE